MYTVLCGATGRNKFLWLMAFDFSRSIIKNYPGPGLLGPTVHCKRKDSNFVSGNSAGDNKNDKIFCIILTKK